MCLAFIGHCAGTGDMKFVQIKRRQNNDYGKMLIYKGDGKSEKT
jgi:hypothetical protein